MEEGADYDKVLKEAHLGFAEANPEADIEGYFVRAMICAKELQQYSL